MLKRFNLILITFIFSSQASAQTLHDIGSLSIVGTPIQNKNTAEVIAMTYVSEAGSLASPDQDEGTCDFYQFVSILNNQINLIGSPISAETLKQQLRKIRKQYKKLTYSTGVAVVGYFVASGPIPVGVVMLINPVGSVAVGTFMMGYLAYLGITGVLLNKGLFDFKANFSARKTEKTLVKSSHGEGWNWASISKPIRNKKFNRIKDAILLSL